MINSSWNNLTACLFSCVVHSVYYFFFFVCDLLFTFAFIEIAPHSPPFQRSFFFHIEFTFCFSCQHFFFFIVHWWRSSVRFLSKLCVSFFVLFCFSLSLFLCWVSHQFDLQSPKSNDEKWLPAQFHESAFCLAIFVFLFFGLVDLVTHPNRIQLGTTGFCDYFLWFRNFSLFLTHEFCVGSLFCIICPFPFAIHYHFLARNINIFSHLSFPVFFTLWMQSSFSLSVLVVPASYFSFIVKLFSHLSIQPSDFAFIAFFSPICHSHRLLSTLVRLLKYRFIYFWSSLWKTTQFASKHKKCPQNIWEQRINYFTLRWPTYWKNTFFETFVLMFSSFVHSIRNLISCL